MIKTILKCGLYRMVIVDAGFIEYFEQYLEMQNEIFNESDYKSIDSCVRKYYILFDNFLIIL